MEKTIKTLKKIMPIIGIILFIYIIINTGIGNIATTLAKISPILVIIAAAITIPSLIIRNTQWQIILKKQKIKIGFLRTLKIILIGKFYSLVTPGYTGYYLRIFYVKDQTKEPLGKLFINTVITGLVNTLPLYIMLVVGALILAEQYPPAFHIAIIFLISHIAVCIYFIKKERGEKTIKKVIKYLIPKKIKNHLNNFTDTFYNDFPKIKDLISPFIIGIILNIIGFIQLYILALSLGITQIDFLPFIAIMSIVYIVTTIPITVGGFGTREAAMIFLFSLYGVAPEKAVALSIARYFVFGMLPSLYGLILALSEVSDKKEISRVRKHVGKAIKGLTSVGSKFL